MLKIKDNANLKELEKFGFEENDFFPNYVYESRTRKCNYVFICVDKQTKEITGNFADLNNTKLNEEQIKHFCPSIFEAGLVEKVEGK